MSLLITANVNVAKLPKEKFIKGKDGSIWYNITISVNDESRFGNNVWLYDPQTKEEREAKKNKHTLGNGRVVWTDGNVILAEQDKTVTEPVLEKAKEDLPF